ncbi:hypothetical protein [Mycolicibacterium arseniciresistens]
MLIGAASAVGAVFVGMPGTAAAQPPAPPPPPPLPNVNAWAPAKLPDYAVTDGRWYAFATPEGITCVLQRNGGYGCSGALPGAPGGANLVSGGPGAPGFSSTSAPLYAGTEAPKPLPPNTRLSFQTVSCGTDGTITSCVDTRTQNGFVISPTASWVVGGNPLVDRPEGTSPYFN